MNKTTTKLDNVNKFLLWEVMRNMRCNRTRMPLEGEAGFLGGNVPQDGCNELTSPLVELDDVTGDIVLL